MAKKIEDLKDKIATILQAQSWQQKDLAEFLKVNESQISRWLAGESTPRWIYLFKIQRLYEEIA